MQWGVEKSIVLRGFFKLSTSLLNIFCDVAIYSCLKGLVPAVADNQVPDLYLIACTCRLGHQSSKFCFSQFDDGVKVWRRCEAFCWLLHQNVWDGSFLTEKIRLLIVIQLQSYLEDSLQPICVMDGNAHLHWGFIRDFLQKLIIGRLDFAANSPDTSPV